MYRLHHGSKEPVFVITNATEKNLYCSQPDAFFCSSGPVIHLHGRSLTTLCKQRAKMPTQVRDTTFCCPRHTADLLCAVNRTRVVESF